MALPEQVVKNAKRANEAHKEAYGKPDESAPPAESREKIAPDNWKDRYSSYKQHADSTIYQLRQNLAAVEGDNRSMLNRISSLEEQLKQAPEQKPFELSREDLELVDEETASVFSKMMDAKVQPIQQKLSDTEAELEQTKAQLKHERDLRQGKEQQQTEVSFKEKLKQLIPDCEQIDRNADFRHWLSGLDELSGRPRRDLAIRAKQMGDVRRVADIYSEWQDQRQVDVDPREQMITPNPGANMETGGQPQGKIWTGPEIKEFYKRKGLGMIEPNEAKRLEQDIFAAQKQGRIR